jgi:hypothetical protein
VKFSLLDGIAKCYHDFVEPGISSIKFTWIPSFTPLFYEFTGQIRLGYAHEAKLHSENTHNIPTFGFKLANSDYVNITNNIKEMLKQPVNFTLIKVFSE